MFGISHPHWVEAVTAVVVPKDGVTVTAVVVPKDGVTVTVLDVKAYVKTRLAGFKRLKYIILADTLPKNPSGKILKRELRPQHANLASARP